MMHRLFVSVLMFCAVTAAAEPAAPGALIDVGGYRLHIVCEGYGTPTVVMDAGLGGNALEWRDVQNEVRKFTRVCTYDRAGYGWSDLGPTPRTSSQIVNELYLLLETLDYEKPFLLVGHSYGGYNVQLFTRRYPFLVSGMVLVDSSHPGQIERFSAPPISLNTAPSTRWGLVKFGRPPKLHSNLPHATRGLIRAQMVRWRTRHAVAQEYLGFRDSAAQLRAAQALPTIPVFVVSRGKRVWPRDEKGNRLERLWLKLQTELAEQSPYSAHLVARHSGHHVHLDQPQLVAYAVAVISDLYRLQAARNEAVEHQDPSGRARIDVPRRLMVTRFITLSHAKKRFTQLRRQLMALPRGLEPLFSA